MVYFRSLASWHFIPLEAAESFCQINFSNFDYQEIFNIWSASGGRGKCTETVYRVFEDKGTEGVTREKVEELRPGFWISSDGEFSKE